MPFESLDFFAIEIPQFDGSFRTSCGDRLAIGTKGDAQDTTTAMPFESLDFFAIEIPQFDGFVVTASGNCLAIGTKGDAIDTRAMSKVIFFLDSIDKPR